MLLLNRKPELDNNHQNDPTGDPRMLDAELKTPTGGARWGGAGGHEPYCQGNSIFFGEP